MRILQVRFKNLNSLAGEWQIDLTHPAFAADGIFAITGPTGAGKTTILDAICLALYGRTPRLNRVTKNGNEIMSRQTGECFAEVTFETQAGRFRCHWSQHRARKKPAGDLQAPRHEIANADSGAIFETRIRGVADQIETATGMDFDRFTRSMLLAQGGFAAFLQAPPDERAPILEQITGTEIYSQISVHVHERRSKERKQLDTLQAELAGMQFLPPEEEQRLTESLERKSLQDAELTRQVARKNQAITWLAGISRLEDELQALDRAKSELRTRFEAFAPERERLRLAHQALELSADYAALTAARKAQDADRGSLGECRKSLPGRTLAATQAEKSMKAASERLAARKAEQHQALPVIRRVRELDLKIAGKDVPIKEVRDSIAELATSLEALYAKQKRDTGDLVNRRTALEELQASLTASEADGGLVEHLAGLYGRFDALRTLHGHLMDKLEETKQADIQFLKAGKACQDQTASLEKERSVLAGIQAKLAEKQNRLLDILAGRDVAQWRKTQSVLTTQNDSLVKAREAVQTLSNSKRATMELDSRKAAFQQAEAALSGALATQTEKRAALEKEVELLETQLTLLKRIGDLEEARGHLQDGEPCPLCGAKEHPFAEGNIPVPDETLRHLTTVRTGLKAVTDDVSDLKVRLAQVIKDMERVTCARNEHAVKISEASRVIAENCSELPPEAGLSPSDPMLGGRLEDLQEENARHLARATSILEAAESIEREAAALRDSLEKARDSVMTSERDALAATHTKDSAGQLFERLRDDASGYKAREEKTLFQLREEIRPFGYETFSIDTLDETLDQLVFRRDRWLDRQREKSGLEQKIAALDMQTRHQAEQIRKMEESDLKKLQDQLKRLKDDRDDFFRERQKLFGDRKADDEEIRLSGAVEAAEAELDTARRTLSSANQELGRLNAKIDDLEQAVGARDLHLKSADGEFLTRLAESGFSGEESFKSACLPESERKQLAQQSQKLSDEQIELASREQEKSGLLKAERQKKITEKSPDELKNALALLTANQKDLQQEIGGMSQRLKDNENLKQQQQERVQTIEAQNRECTRWDLLHELIGSADGKKYRNFAQGLTFEIMVGHANRQLQKMTDRYLLVRDDSQPLELNVIDNYQAGEVRSTKNLSGGESFIVSLALALGLSGMASRNVRVDSLFLDEGFGTLDEDALETALETLAGLQQEGKLIGIISHVPALKERIGARIQVEAGSAGRSSLSGPGCRRLP